MDLKSYLNSTTSDKLQTPLHLAAMYGSRAVAECLISDFEVNKEARDYKDRTPLFIAAEYSKQLFVFFLT